MSRKYIDFVPAKKTVKLPEAAPVQRRRVMKRSDVGAANRSASEVAIQKTVMKKTTVKRAVVAKSPSVRMATTPTTTRVRSQDTGYGKEREGLSLNSGARLGEIEDVNPRFVMTDVPKRPLGETQTTTAKNEVSSAKAKRSVGRVSPLRNTKQQHAETKVQVMDKVAKEPASDRYEMPKSPFINQDKVVKRPLSSKNVYSKQAPVDRSAKQSNKPVTIISKPEKESHIGVIVTIILTIIFGAVAGTVAFLLLPK